MSKYHIVGNHGTYIFFLAHMVQRSRPQGYKKNSCSTQLSTKLILFINVKMPTIVGILTFISMIKIQQLRDLKQETSLFVRILVFMSNWNFLFCWVEHEKYFITSGGPGLKDWALRLYDLKCSRQLSIKFMLLRNVKARKIFFIFHCCIL